MISLRPLIARLNPACHAALEAAIGKTLGRTHYNVEIEHWLLQLLDATQGDLALLIGHYGVDAGRLTADLNRVVDRFKTGNARAPSLSPQLVKLIRQAWLLASVEYDAPRIRSSHLLTALLADDDLRLLASEISGQFARFPIESLKADLASLTKTSPEVEAAAPGPAASSDMPGMPGGRGSGALDRYCNDLTAAARAGKIDPVLGRDPEIRQIIDILMRRRQNNPILTGEAGVGKTAVVEGFALRIVVGDVPDALKPIRLLSLDLGLLQAGAGVKGEFENRLKSVIQDVKDSPTPIVMFIDEAHTLIGAGGAEGQNDAANLLKPALARGEMRTVAATTWAEYKKYFEKDPALTRRFQVVKIEEPGEDSAIQMMRGLVGMLEKHHRVRILDEAVDASVRLSHRYLAGRQLPDKAISLLDTSCARVAISQAATPPAVEDAQRRISLLETEIAILEREAQTGADHAKTLAARGAALATARQALQDLTARWTAERAAMTALREAREALESAAEPTEEQRATLKAARETVSALQGEVPLIYDVVDHQAVAEVLAAWTGIPVGRMMSDAIQRVLDIRAHMGERIRGQPQALDAIAQVVQAARAKLADPRKPLGVFLMCGTSGVGKTETALTLAELLYGGEQNLTVINMSEFKEEHKVSMLVGSPPGYIGYGEGGVLTEAVRRKPYSVVLLDEMEKAHPGVQDVFYQVFDKGMLKDGQGRDIDFRNTLIIMTSNAGTETIEKLWADPETMPDAEGLIDALRPELLKVFKPAFLGRTTLVPYFPLPSDILREIVIINLQRIARRVAENYGATLTWEPAVVDWVVARCTESQSGARLIETVLRRTLLPNLSTLFLERMAEQKPIGDVAVAVSPDGGFAYSFPGNSQTEAM